MNNIYKKKIICFYTINFKSNEILGILKFAI